MPRLSGYSMVSKRCFGLRNFGEKKCTSVIGALCGTSLTTASMISKFLKLGLKDDLLPKLPEKAYL